MQQIISSIALLVQRMNKSVEAFSRGSFQELPLSQCFMPPGAPAQSQGEFNHMLSQQTYFYDGIDKHSSFYVNNSLRSSNVSRNQKNYFDSDSFKTYHKSMFRIY